MVGRVWPRHRHRGRPLNSVVRLHEKHRGNSLLWPNAIASLGERPWFGSAKARVGRECGRRQSEVRAAGKLISYSPG